MSSIDSSYATVLNSFLSYASAIDHVSTNISNANTAGYKRFDVQFLSNEHDSCMSPFRSYMGNVQMIARNQIDLNGDLISTDRSTYAAIVGNGFFPVRANISNNQKNEVLLTADGAFDKKLVPDGNIDRIYLVNGSGNFLLGWPYNPTTGTYIKGNNVSSLQPVEVDSIHNASQAKSTTLATLSANLPSDDNPSTKTDHKIDFNAFDGMTDTAHKVTAHFTKIDHNTWTMHLTTADGRIKEPDTILIKFNNNGKMILPQNPIVCKIAWGNPKPIDTEFKIKLSDFTQYASKFTILKADSDGQGSGSLQDLFFDKDGVIKAKFSNGDVRPVYKIPSATVTAVNQMAREASEVFKPTLSSGPIRLDDFSNIQHASFVPKQIMQSNVNETTSMGNSIKFEEGYQETTDAFQAIQKTIQETIDLIQA